MKKILIANRGEIAVRIIRACKEMGIRTVAVYSTVDKEALHTKIADESVCIGPPASSKSYLNIASIMAAAELTGADGIHPGYGFLSENAKFAEICIAHNTCFIGPKPEHIFALGNKIQARAAAEKAKVPLLPGSKGVVKTFKEALKVAKEIGFPVIIKAAAGGGGRGMKIINIEQDLEVQLGLAQSEALAGFGNGDVYIEKYLRAPRHVEIQLLADNHGNIIHLGERDCSVQRRHQKLLEESPCPVMTPELRKIMGDTAVRLAKSVGYQSVGTCEFLLDENGQFYFMEVNSRIQVEHTVTEEVTGMDLIKEQIKAALGEKLRKKQSDIVLTGHALECRINAEDPVSFVPWPGKVTNYFAPGGRGIRVDSALYAGFTVPSNYDSMIAKLITHGEDRAECLARMRSALSEMKVEGIRTNISFHQKVLQDENFISGNFSTRFLENFQQNSK